MKHLYRSQTNKVFGGLFGGLGEYFEVDPVVLRLMGVLILIFTGLVPGLIFYIFALIIVPKHGHN
jgi:phage shock protein C